jgi:5-methyltetrahydropteroyltriglutamate--homocysteine methyltransferase
MSAPSHVLAPSIVGSLPKPVWLAEPNRLRAPWRLSGAALAEAQDDAVRLALLEQEEAGMSVVTDGELRRRHYIWGFLDGLTGTDTERLTKKRSRAGRYSELTEVARLVGPVERRAPVFVEACRFARRHTRRTLKVTLPGPMTVADSVADEAGDADFETLSMRFAAILNAEARDLVEAGADVVQFDEPCFNIYLDEVSAWGIAALEIAMAGVAARKAVHICYGYGTPLVLGWKAQNTDWGHYAVTLPLLAKSSVDQVSVETAASGVDVSVLAALRGKDVLVGVVDVGTDEVETPEVVAARIRRVLPFVNADRLHPCTDCGLVPRSRTASKGKMAALAAGAAIIRGEVATVRGELPSKDA